MNYKTHLVFGFLFGYIAFPYINPINRYLFFAFVLIGALLPDIDFSGSKIGERAGIISWFIEKVFKHRGLFHSLFIGILFSSLIFIWLDKSYGIALFIGYLSHLICDGLTKTGINFLHPFANLTLTGFIETGGFIEIFFFISVITILVFARLVLHW